MKLATVTAGGCTSAARAEADGYILLYADAGELPRQPGRRETAADGESVAAADVRIEPAVPNPPKTVCPGRNDAEHVFESGQDLPEQPVFFAKFGSPLTGPLDDMPEPRPSERLDREAEPARWTNTGKMISDVATVIAGISVFPRVEPGDVTLTGTPSGAGNARDPKVFLKPGQVVVTRVEGAGETPDKIVEWDAADGQD